MKNAPSIGLKPLLVLAPILLVAQSAAADGRLELDQPAPARDEVVQVAGACASAGETVSFSFEQKNKTRQYDASVKTNENAEFKANIHLAHVNAKNGPATLRAECSGGKTAQTDFKVGVRTSTAGAATSLAAETDEAATGKEEYRGRGHNADRLRISSKTPPKLGADISITGECPSEDGNISFSVEQGENSFKVGRMVLAGQTSFRHKLKLEGDGLKPGKAKIIAECPGGKLLTKKVNIKK